MAASKLDMGTILKYGAIAAGLYLAWRSGLFDQFGLFFIPLSPGATTPPAVSAGGGDPTVTPAGGTLTTTPTVSGGGAPVATPAAPFMTADQIDALTKKAAAGDAVAAAQMTSLGIRYTGHQWNWFRATQTKVDAPATPGLDGTFNANEYLAYRVSNGLSGIGSLGNLPLGAIRVYGNRRPSVSMV